jgi:hypothetical protein
MFTRHVLQNSVSEKQSLHWYTAAPIEAAFRLVSVDALALDTEQLVQKMLPAIGNPLGHWMILNSHHQRSL